MFYRVAILSLAMSGAMFAQAAPEKPKTPTPEERWLAPAQSLTASIDADIFRLPRPMQAVAQAHLASIWWTHEPARARKWADNAVDWVTHTPDNESTDDRALRIRAARIVLSDVTSLDEGMGQRISAALAAAISDTPSVRASMSAAMVGNAMRDSDHPDRLVKAISDSFQYGVTSATFQGLITLRDKDPEQADLLFQQTLSNISQGGDPSQGRMIIAALRGPANEKVLPDAWRPPAFAVIGRLLSVEPPTPDLQKKRCELASQVSGRTREGYPVEVMQAADTVRSGCQSPQATPQQQADSEIFRSRSPKTADDYLALADELKDPGFRAQMKMNAATRAELDDHDFDRALAIWDGMSPDEMYARGGIGYMPLRSELAVRASINAFEDGRPERAQKIIETSPENTRAFIAAQFLEKEQKKSVPRVFYSVALREATIRPVENPFDLLSLLNTFAKVGDPNAMGEIVKAMDHWQPHDPKSIKPGETFYVSPWDSLALLQLRQEMTEMDPSVIAAKFKEAQGTLLRTDLQLAAIRAWVTRYRSESEKSERAVRSEDLPQAHVH